MKSIVSEVVPLDAEGQVWDAIVIGTGAGGATAGFNLARLGRSVLFVERGKLLHHHPMVARGDAFWWTGDPEKALNHGWWPRPLYQQQEDGALLPTGPPIGCGAGGSTAQFRAVMDRFRPEDFTPRRFSPEAPDAALPEAWPVSYEEMSVFTSGRSACIGSGARKTHSRRLWRACSNRRRLPLESSPLSRR